MDMVNTWTYILQNKARLPKESRFVYDKKVRSKGYRRSSLKRSLVR